MKRRSWSKDELVNKIKGFMTIKNLTLSTNTNQRVFD